MINSNETLNANAVNSEIEKANKEVVTIKRKRTIVETTKSAKLQAKEDADKGKKKKVSETKSESKKSLSDILSIGNNVLSSKTNKFGATLYKNELFAECVTDKDKKSLRIKLRRKLDSFFSEYVMNQNNKEKLTELKSAWKQYASIVYIDANNIVDSNSSSDKQDIAKRFLSAMNK